MRVEMICYLEQHILLFFIQKDSAIVLGIEQSVRCSRVHQIASITVVDQVDDVLQLRSSCIDEAASLQRIGYQHSLMP